MAIATGESFPIRLQSQDGMRPIKFCRISEWLLWEVAASSATNSSRNGEARLAPSGSRSWKRLMTPAPRTICTRLHISAPMATSSCLPTKTPFFSTTARAKSWSGSPPSTADLATTHLPDLPSCSLSMLQMGKLDRFCYAYSCGYWYSFFAIASWFLYEVS